VFGVGNVRATWHVPFETLPRYAAGRGNNSSCRSRRLNNDDVSDTGDGFGYRAWYREAHDGKIWVNRVMYSRSHFILEIFMRDRGI
jgi:hypothetical protein